MGARTKGAVDQPQGDRGPNWLRPDRRFSPRWTSTRTTTIVTQLITSDQRLRDRHQSLNEVAPANRPRTATTPRMLRALVKVRRICVEATRIRLDNPKATASMIGDTRVTSPPISRQMHTPGVAVSNNCLAVTEAGADGCRCEPLRRPRCGEAIGVWRRTQDRRQRLSGRRPGRTCWPRDLLNRWTGGLACRRGPMSRPPRRIR